MRRKLAAESDSIDAAGAVKITRRLKIIRFSLPVNDLRYQKGEVSTN
jgi:hypothetical protein